MRRGGHGRDGTNGNWEDSGPYYGMPWLNLTTALAIGVLGAVSLALMSRSLEHAGAPFAVGATQA